MSKNAAAKVTTRTTSRTATKPGAKKALASKTKPVTFEEAKRRTFANFDEGLRRLAK